MTVNSLFYFMKSIMENIRLHRQAILDISESGSRKTMKAFDFFYYINGRFPTNNDLITALDGDIPDFIKIKLPGQKISPHRLYEMFRGKRSHVLVSTQFLSGLNIFLDGNLQISKNGMAEFYHNLPIQALTHFMPLASFHTP